MKKILMTFAMTFMLLLSGLMIVSDQVEASSPTVVVHTTDWYVNSTAWVNDSIIYMEDVDLIVQYEATLYLDNCTMQFNTTSNNTRIIEVNDNGSFYANDCVFDTNWTIMYWMGIYLNANTTSEPMVYVTDSEFHNNCAVFWGDYGQEAYFENIQVIDMYATDYPFYSFLNTTVINMTFQGYDDYSEGMMEFYSDTWEMEVYLQDIDITQVEFLTNTSEWVGIYVDGYQTHGMNITIDGLKFYPDVPLEDAPIFWFNDTNATVSNVEYDNFAYGIVVETYRAGDVSFNTFENITGTISNMPGCPQGSGHLFVLAVTTNNLIFSTFSNCTFTTIYQNSTVPGYNDGFTYYYSGSVTSQIMTGFWNTSFISPDSTVEYFHYNDGSVGNVMTELSSCNVTGAETLHITGSTHRNSIISRNTDYWNYVNTTTVGIYGADSTSIDLLYSNGATFERDFLDDININLTESPLIYQPLVDDYHSSYINGSSGVDYGGVMEAIGDTSLHYIGIDPDPFPNGWDWWQLIKIKLIEKILPWAVYEDIELTDDLVSRSLMQTAIRGTDDMVVEVSSVDLFMNRTGVPNDGITIKIIIPGTTNQTVSETNITADNITDGWYTYDIENFIYQEGVNYSIQILSHTNQTNGTWNVGYYSNDDNALTSSAVYTKDAVGEDNWTLVTGDLAFRLNVEIDTSYVDGSPIPYLYVENSGYYNVDTYNNNSYVSNMTFDVVGETYHNNLTLTSRFGSDSVYWSPDTYDSNFEFENWDEYAVESTYNVSMNLRAGWNLISLPLNVTLSSGTLFAYDSNITQITAYQGGQYVSAVRSITNISLIDPYKGFFVYCTRAVTLNLTGTTMTPDELVDHETIVQDDWTLKGMPLAYEIFGNSQIDRNVMNFHNADYLVYTHLGNFFTTIKGIHSEGFTIDAGEGYYVWG